MKNKEDDLEKEWKKLKGKLLLDIVNENSKKKEVESKDIDVKKKVNPWKFDNFVGEQINIRDSTVLLEDKGLSDKSNLEQNINPFGSASPNNFDNKSQKVLNEPKYIESFGGEVHIDKNVGVEPTSLRPVVEDIPKDMIRSSFVDPLSSRAEFREFQDESASILGQVDVDNKKYMEKDSR